MRRGFSSLVAGLLLPISSHPRDGLFYTTGHHAPELHVLRRPAAGAILELVRVISVESEGQGIALDPVDSSLLWSIQRKTGEVLVSRLP
jgi:hypothetical protein